MKRSQQRRQRLFWLLSLLVVLSMIGGTIATIFLSSREPAAPSSALPWVWSLAEPALAALIGPALPAPLGL